MGMISTPHVLTTLVTKTLGGHAAGARRALMELGENAGVGESCRLPGYGGHEIRQNVQIMT